MFSFLISQIICKLLFKLYCNKHIPDLSIIRPLKLFFKNHIYYEVTKSTAKAKSFPNLNIGEKKH